MSAPNLTQTFIDLVGEVGVDGVADLLVSALEVEADGAEDDAAYQTWRGVREQAVALRDRIRQVTRGGR